MEFRILGPVEARVAGRAVPRVWAKERIILASLLLAGDRPVRTETLIGRIWDGEPPPNARNLLYPSIARLRHQLARPDARDRLTRAPGAYLLDAGADDVDYRRFSELRKQARALAGHGERAEAARVLADAERLVSGTPLQNVSGDWAARTRRRLAEELLRSAIERFELILELGRHEEVAGEVPELVAANPENERPVALLMLALHRCGRSGEALAEYENARRRLDERLGVAPGTALRELHRRILAGDPALDPPASSAASVASRSPAPVNDLPRDVGTFTGRRREMEALLALADDDSVSVIAIDGMPGVGKTTLAVHLAHRIAARYPDGCLFLHLYGHSRDRRPADPAEALGTLLRKIGVEPDLVPADTDGRSELWRSRLAHRRVLVVLDDALGVAQVNPLLPGGAGCLVIATGRRALAGLDDARPLPLDVLPPDEAAALFVRVSGTDLAPSGPEVAEIVRLCGHLPLALQLTGNRLRHRARWTVADLARRLRARPGRLAEIRAEDRRLRTAFELSFEGLPRPLQDAFRLLSLHPGPTITAEAAGALLNMPQTRAEAVLEELADHHLLAETERGHHRFHDLLHEYAQELADPPPPPAVPGSVRRLLGHYLALAESADRTRLEEESGNLVPVTAYSAAHGLDDYTGRFGDALADHLEESGRWDDALHVHRAAVRARRAQGDDAGTARALAHLARTQWRTGDQPAALESAAEALRIHQRLGDEEGTAGVLDQLGLIHWTRSEFDVASGYFEQALRLRRSLGDQSGEATTLDHAAIVRFHQGRYAEAVGLLREALKLHEAAGDRVGERKTLNNLAELEITFERPRAALSYFQRIGNMAGLSRQHRANLLHNFGRVYDKLGRYDEALVNYRDALAIYSEIGDRRGEADCLVNLGEHYANAAGRDGEALLHLNKALQLARDIREPFQQVRALLGLARTHHRAGRASAALTAFEEARDLARSVGDANQEAWALWGIGSVKAVLHGEVAARPFLRRSLQLFTALGLPPADAVRAQLEGGTDASSHA
ncbi:NACHT domain-containing protein [Actinomadura logoneensis]|uniref:NACHT domain-containing protein n=1 Tax=Actinomadura logoneensis TaxID=2293572 RepID=A0A372JPA7_9ACTN|nr:tetratricopeptide repeat protein [Actinomadura logoneensis]RFU41853.1 NACHT domain-containing protein [Actinomadura logoneensis]